MSTAGRIKILVVDRTRMSFLKEAQQMYIDRLSHYTVLEWIEVKPALYKKLPSEKILLQEAASMRKKIAPEDYVVALDKDGRTANSEDFASHLLDLVESARPVAFLVGGALGIHRQLIKAANERLSLSPLTLTHEWARVILLEQIYRAFTIFRGESYHK